MWVTITSADLKSYYDNFHGLCKHLWSPEADSLLWSQCFAECAHNIWGVGGDVTMKDISDFTLQSLKIEPLNTAVIYSDTSDVWVSALMMTLTMVDFQIFLKIYHSLWNLAKNGELKLRTLLLRVLPTNLVRNSFLPPCASIFIIDP